jgi:hypothetical protein
MFFFFFPPPPRHAIVVACRNDDPDGSNEAHRIERARVRGTAGPSLELELNRPVSSHVRECM